MAVKCECGLRMGYCQECPETPVCYECDWECNGEDGLYCHACRDEQRETLMRELRALRPLVQRHLAVCEDLDLPSHATDEDVMSAARGLK